MKLKGVRLIIISIFAIMLFSVTMFIYVAEHEIAHKEICEKFGGKADIKYGIANSTTLCTIPISNVTDNHRLAQSYVEAIGYQLQTPILLLYLGVLLMFVMVLK